MAAVGLRSSTSGSLERRCWNGLCWQLSRRWCMLGSSCWAGDESSSEVVATPAEAADWKYWFPLPL